MKASLASCMMESMFSVLLLAVLSSVKLNKKYLMGGWCNGSQLADLINEILVIITAAAVLELFHAHLNAADSADTTKYCVTK